MPAVAAGLARLGDLGVHEVGTVSSQHSALTSTISSRLVQSDHDLHLLARQRVTLLKHYRRYHCLLLTVESSIASRGCKTNTRATHRFADGPSPNAS